VPNFRVVPSVTGVLRTILPPSFDPARLAVLETDPGLEPTPHAEPGDATYREDSPERVRIGVRATAPSIVVVRSTFDEGWHATVDGAPAAVMPVDGFLQGIAVPEGEHEVLLTYRDPAVTSGVRAGVLAWGLLVLAAAASIAWERRRRVSPMARPGGAAPPR
jgi:hypothetical protein